MLKGKLSVTGGTDADLETLATPTDITMSVGQLIDAGLKAKDAKVTAIYNRTTGSIEFRDGTCAVPTNALEFLPVDPTKRVTAFTVESHGTGTPLGATLGEVILPQTPQFSIATLVNAIDDKATDDGGYIVVDQFNGNVFAAASGVTPSGGLLSQIHIEPVVSTSPARNPFE